MTGAFRPMIQLDRDGEREESEERERGERRERRERWDIYIYMERVSPK